jgi:hypothetical protein
LGVVNCYNHVFRFKSLQVHQILQIHQGLHMKLGPLQLKFNMLRRNLSSNSHWVEKCILLCGPKFSMMNLGKLSGHVYMLMLLNVFNCQIVQLLG